LVRLTGRLSHRLSMPLLRPRARARMKSPGTSPLPFQFRRKAKMRSRIVSLDQALILASSRIRAGELRTCGFVLRVMSRAGDGYLWIALLFIALATKRTKAAEAGILAATLGTSASLFLKHTCRRARPPGARTGPASLPRTNTHFPAGIQLLHSPLRPSQSLTGPASPRLCGYAQGV
jgi:hypothetical protein